MVIVAIIIILIILLKSRKQKALRNLNISRPEEKDQAAESTSPVSAAGETSDVSSRLENEQKNPGLSRICKTVHMATSVNMCRNKMSERLLQARSKRRLLPAYGRKPHGNTVLRRVFPMSVRALSGTDKKKKKRKKADKFASNFLTS